MIPFLIIVIGAVILGSIFLRRYMMVEKGIASFSIISILGGRKKSFLDLLHFHGHSDRNDNSTLELVIEEMIPDASTIDAKKSAKANILIKKADADLAHGDQLHAEKHLIQALALDPSRVETYSKLGLLYLHQGQFSKAENMYQKLIASSQEDPVYYSNLAVALYQQQKLEAAKTNYKKAIELDSSRAGRFFSLAQVLKELGELHEAIENFKKAIEMDPKNMDYLLTLAQVYIDGGMAAEARELLGDILMADPGNEMAGEMLKKL